MFCAKCGNELPENALFCGECGSRVDRDDFENTDQQMIPPVGQQPAMQQTAVQQQANLPADQQVYIRTNAKPVQFITKVLVIEVVIFAILAFISYTKIKEYVSPETVAKSYFTAVMSGDVKKAYDLIDVDEDEFVNEKYFRELLKDIGQKNIYNYKVDNTEDTGDNLDFKKRVNITYRVKEDTSDYNFYIGLEKSPSKKLFLFDDWKVNVGDYIQKDVTIYVNQGSKVILNGTELDKKYLSDEKDEDSWSEYYVIPKMFSGTYEILITNDIYMDCKKSIVVNEDSTYFYESEYDGITLKPEIIEDIAKQSQKDFKTLCNGAVQQKSFKNVNDIPMAEDTSEIEEDYDKLVETFIKKDGEGLQKIEFGNFEVTAEGDTEYPAVYVKFSASFSCITTSKDWWSGQLENNEYSGDYTGDMNYIYQNGEWKLQNILISNFYYY